MVRPWLLLAWAVVSSARCCSVSGAGSNKTLKPRHVPQRHMRTAGCSCRAPTGLGSERQQRPRVQELGLANLLSACGGAACCGQTGASSGTVCGRRVPSDGESGVPLGNLCRTRCALDSRGCMLAPGLPELAPALAACKRRGPAAGAPSLCMSAVAARQAHSRCCSSRGHRGQPVGPCCDRGCPAAHTRSA